MIISIWIFPFICSSFSCSSFEFFSFSHALSYLHKVGPATLLGGTAAVYASVLQHPSSTLTPLSVLYMLLLAIQYAIQPKWSKQYISPSTSKQSVALVEELVKTTMAAGLLLTYASPTTRSVFSSWTLSSSLAVAALPASLYAIQGVLQYTSHQHLDTVTFNGLSQTKTISAALCCFLLFKTPQSSLQMMALLLLFCSSLLFQQTTATTNNHNNNNNNTYKSSSFLLGILPCLGATLTSGLAGALSQQGLQHQNRDAYVYTMEVSFYSALCLLLSMSRHKTPFFHGWTRYTWIPILLKAAGGVLTALVHKYAGSVPKGFALMFGLVLSQLGQAWFLNQDITTHQWMGTMLVILSGWMHFTNPPITTLVS